MTETNNAYPKKMSPLKRYIEEHCKGCKDHQFCNSDHNRRLNCILSAQLFADKEEKK